MSKGDETEPAAAPPRPRKKKKKKKRAASEPSAPVASPVAAATPAPPGVFTPQRIVLVAAALAAVGLALASHGPSDTGRVFWIAGTLLFVVGIHMLGRLGPEGLGAPERLHPPANESIEPPT